MGFDTNHFKKLIFERLQSDSESIRGVFKKNQDEFGIGYVSIDNLLPEQDALHISNSFDPANLAWREMSSFREKKLTSKQYQSFNSVLGEITFAFQEKEVIDLVSDLTGIKNQIADSKLYAGGLSMMRTGDFLDPHIDNSHEHTRHYYRRLNLLYYVTPQWSLSDGGNLELWNRNVREKVTIESKFNRLVLMETNPVSWHSVSQVAKPDGFRKCVSNYYFSENSPTGHDYYHVTSFMARPNQPVKRLVCKIDNFARNLIRKIKPSGIGKVDLYSGNK